MSDISTILQNILSAIYGKDVRQAIHDGIELCYTDATQTDTTLTQSGRSADSKTVGDRFDDLESQITVVDQVPTENSTNAVQSGGVKSALDTLQAQIPHIDTTLSQSGQAADAKVVGDKIRQEQTGFIQCESGTFADQDGVSKYISPPRIRNVYPVSIANYVSITIPN